MKSNEQYFCISFPKDNKTHSTHNSPHNLFSFSYSFILRTDFFFSLSSPFYHYAQQDQIKGENTGIFISKNRYLFANPRHHSIEALGRDLGIATTDASTKEATIRTLKDKNSRLMQQHENEKDKIAEYERKEMYHQRELGRKEDEIAMLKRECRGRRKRWEGARRR